MASRAASVLAMLAALAGGVGTAAADGPLHGDHALGKVDFKVSCTAPAQAKFEHALALLHHMTYPQARTGFRETAAIDPQCAMAHWGVAMTLFQPLWPTRPSADDFASGRAEVAQARALKPATERERLFVDAAGAFFDQADDTYWVRIARWHDAQGRLVAARPKDDEAVAFWALSHLATAPADRIDRKFGDEAADALLQVHARNPEHPGAMHYLVHANDMPGREHESIEITHQYDAAAPRNPHALHMPTHIYTRLGDWDRVIDGNLRAAEAALEHPTGEHGELVWDEFAHAIEYLVYAYLQQGDDVRAQAQIQRLLDTTRLEPSFKTAFHTASTQARYALERRDWVAAANLQPRTPSSVDWDRFPWAEAIAQFAHGLGAAHTGDLDTARAASARIDLLSKKMEAANEQLFARHIRVLRLDLDGWIAQADGKPADALRLLRQAAKLEADTPKHAVTPAPTLPADEQLGDLLMAQGRPAEALAAYRDALKRHPNRFNGLLGAARAANAAGDGAAARESYAKLLDVAGKGTRNDALAEARAATVSRP